jgi:two-component system nitrogen regulation response regulator NtrX
MNKILIVDDEQSIVDSLSLILKGDKHEVKGALNGMDALEMCKKENFDLILLDIKMPMMDGLEVLAKLMEMDKDNVVIMITGHGTVETAFEASKLGAYNFLQKPLPDLMELRLVIKNALDYKNAKNELKQVKHELEEKYKIVGKSPEITQIRELIKKFADSSSNIFIYGESGTGKELTARQIHLASQRGDCPFIKINCANLNPLEIENELFGYVDGSGIYQKGKFEEAQGGTIYFDEISNLSPEVQSRLLRALEENQIQVSDNRILKLDIRFIFTSNKDILTEIDEKRFRDDLFHRINVLQINIPPLRERVEDIPELIDYYSSLLCRMNNIPVKKFTNDAITLLKDYRFPGNVRELKNLIERLIITIDKKNIDADDIEVPGTKHTRVITDLINKNFSLNDFQNESEKLFLMKMLNDYQYNITQTAEALQIQRSHLYKLMNKYNIPLPSKRTVE